MMITWFKRRTKNTTPRNPKRDPFFVSYHGAGRYYMSQAISSQIPNSINKAKIGAVIGLNLLIIHPTNEGDHLILTRPDDARIVINRGITDELKPEHARYSAKISNSGMISVDLTKKV